MAWKHEQELQTWRQSTERAIVGIDFDGDIGIMDAKGYSIVLSARGAKRLRDWLNEHFPANSDAVAAGLREACEKLEAAERAAEYYRNAHLQNRGKAQPPAYVPDRIRLPNGARGDFPFHYIIAPAGDYDAICNRLGAVSVMTPSGEELGLRLDEFVVLKWKPNAATKPT